MVGFGEGKKEHRQNPLYTKNWSYRTMHMASTRGGIYNWTGVPCLVTAVKLRLDNRCLVTAAEKCALNAAQDI